MSKAREDVHLWACPANLAASPKMLDSWKIRHKIAGQTIASVNKLAALCEKHGHPPDLVSAVASLRTRLVIERLCIMEMDVKLPFDVEEFGPAQKALGNLTEEIRLAGTTLFRLVRESGLKTPAKFWTTPIHPFATADRRPEVLSLDFAPRRFEGWKADFREYHSATQTETLPLPVQQDYVYLDLDDVLTLRLREKMTETTPIFGPCSCMELLEEEFLLRYPMHERRMKFLASKQAKGQSFSDWEIALRSLAWDAGLDNSDEILSALMLNGIRDGRLKRDVLLKVDGKSTSREISEIVANLEAVHATKRSFRVKANANIWSSPDRVKICPTWHNVVNIFPPMKSATVLRMLLM